MLRLKHLADGQLDPVRHPDVADRGAGAGDGDRGVHRLARAHALQHRVGADTVGELEHGGLALATPLGDDVGRTELPGQALA